MFDFVVRHLRFLARVPLLPQIFESCLTVQTFLWHREVLRAMEKVESSVDSSIGLKPHRLGGTEFVDRQSRRELGHFHGNGLLDVKVGRENAVRLLAAGRVRPHHVLPQSGWVSFPMKSPEDAAFALELLEIAKRRA